MKTFNVRVNMAVTYIYKVEANDEEEAKEIGREKAEEVLKTSDRLLEANDIVDEEASEMLP